VLFLRAVESKPKKRSVYCTFLHLVSTSYASYIGSELLGTISVAVGLAAGK
jgi:hypothetical protein